MFFGFTDTLSDINISDTSLLLAAGVVYSTCPTGTSSYSVVSFGVYSMNSFSSSEGVEVYFPSTMESSTFASMPSSIFDVGSNVRVFSDVSSESTSLDAGSVSFISPN